MIVRYPSSHCGPVKVSMLLGSVKKPRFQESSKSGGNLARFSGLYSPTKVTLRSLYRSHLVRSVLYGLEPRPVVA